MMSPENFRSIIQSIRELYLKKMEADKAKLAAIGVTEITLEEYLLFEKMTEALSGAFLDFLKSGPFAKKEAADAATPA